MSIGELITDLLRTTELSNQQIVDAVKKQFPEAKTTTKSVASVASVARKYGVAIAKRPSVSPLAEVAQLKREIKVLKYLLGRKDRLAA